MRGIRNTFWFIVGVALMFILASCATTPLNPTEKAQYIATARATLESANMGITVTSIVFLGLCETEDISSAICKVGKTSLKRWDSLYTTTQDTISQYELGNITERGIVIKAVAETMAIFILIRHDLEGIN